jgi:hypothetical protein
MKTRQGSGSTPTRKYRWQWWALLPSLLTYVYMVPALSLAIGVLVYVIVWLLRWGNLQFYGIVVIVVLSMFLVPCVLLWLMLVSMPIGRLFLSYLKIAPDGVEYRYWPSYAVRCNWSDVERVGIHRSYGIFSSEVLYLKGGEPIGPQITMAFRRTLGLKTQYFIPLTGIRGWPDGGLANDLRQYLPHVFGSNNVDEQLKDHDC